MSYGTLRLDLKPGDSFKIGDFALVTLEAKTGGRARLSVKADRSIPIDRKQKDSESRSAAKFGITGKEA